MKSRGGRRRRWMWIAAAGTLVGIAVLAALAIRVEIARDSDLAPSEGVTASFLNSGAAAAPPIVFRDVAVEMGVVMRHGAGHRRRRLPEDTGSGLAWADYDGDGDPDLYCVNFPGTENDRVHSDDSNHLFRNDGDRFTDVTAASGAGDPSGFGMGASFADYDADGDLDLYVTNFGPNRLFRNRGDGTFEDVAARAGVDDAAWSTGAAWGDYDRDGDLDLYVCNYVRYDASVAGPEIELRSSGGAYTVPYALNPNSFDPEPNRLFRNRGDGTFEDVAVRFGVADEEGRSLAATFCDLDGDGWLDLYVNNDASPNKLFRNMLGEGRTRFADLSTLTGTADDRSSMGLSVGELGSMCSTPDGLPDLFSSNWVAQEDALYISVAAAGGGLEYRDRGRQLQLAELTLDTVGWGSALTDLDKDGRADLVVANGSTLEDRTDPSQLVSEPLFVFWNEGTRFVNVAERAGPALALRHNARGLAAADFDGDGDIDFAVSVNRGQPLLLRNDTVTPHGGLTVRLRGTPAASRGAKVALLCGGQPQVQWCGADVSYLSQHAAPMLFGLGPAIEAERLVVRWADGRESERVRVASGSVVIDHATSIVPGATQSLEVHP